MAVEKTGSDTIYTFTVTRSVLLSGTASVAWAVTGSGANPTNAADFLNGVLPSGVLNFADGEAVKTIDVTVLGDVVVEPDEQFTMTISNPSSGSVANASISVTITNDDVASPPPPPPPPAPSIIAPPTVGGDAFETGILWGDPGLDSPTTTYTLRWLSGVTTVIANMAPLSGQTGLSLTVPPIGGDYVVFEVTPANGQAIRYSDPIRIHHAVISAPILARVSASGATPFTYTVNYPDDTVEPSDIERVQYSSNIAFGEGDILWDATRGLTEAAFASPFLSDDSANADPAWSTPPPTFTGTYFVRRKVIALNTLNSAPVESVWSNIESNVTVDVSVRLDPAASWDNPEVGEPSDKYTFSPDLLTFTHPGDYRSHAGRVNYARTGRRTAEMIMNSVPTGGRIGFGFDDGLFNWAAPETGQNNNTKFIDQNGWKGFWLGFNNSDVEVRKANGTTTVATTINAGGGITPWAQFDVARIDYTPGTFTGQTPNNNGTAELYRVRAGVATLLTTVTGIVSMASAKVIFAATDGKSGTFKFTGLTPAIPAGSQEYQ